MSLRNSPTVTNCGASNPVRWIHSPTLDQDSLSDTVLRALFQHELSGGQLLGRSDNRSLDIFLARLLRNQNQLQPLSSDESTNKRPVETDRSPKLSSPSMSADVSSRTTQQQSQEQWSVVREAFPGKSCQRLAEALSERPDSRGGRAGGVNLFDGFVLRSCECDRRGDLAGGGLWRHGGCGPQSSQDFQDLPVDALCLPDH